MSKTISEGFGDETAWEMSESNPLDDPEERQVLYAALDSFRQYRNNAHYATTHRRRQNYYALPQDQWKLLAGPPFNLLDTFTEIDDAIDINADLADEILKIGLLSMGIEQTGAPESRQFWHNKAKPDDHSKAHSTLRQFYRDWSAQGFELEVKPILDLILSDLQAGLPPLTQASILLPGAGLGRLLFELTLAGYHITGNEISYHQLLASNFILNHTPHANAYTLSPFLSTFTNNLSRDAQLASFTIPDIQPSTTLATAVSQGKTIGSMNMTAGDFILTYSDPSQRSTFDAIVTVYFIDTAPNLIRYIQTVQNCLRPGGLWINLGPLLWHFDGQSPSSSKPEETQPAELRSTSTDRPHDQPLMGTKTSPKHPQNLQEDTGIANPGSFELSHTEVLALLTHFNFSIVKSETDLDEKRYGRYIQDPESMVQTLYRCVHWVVRKGS